MRRPLASRDKNWAKKSAQFLAARGVRPNAVSMASIVCAMLAFACFILTRDIEYSKFAQIALWLLAAGFIQLRLLCNLLDGMLAVEFGQKSPLGPIYNDFPDRIADVFIIAGAGYTLSAFAWSSTLGWIAAAFALITAYVRVLGVAVGAPENFIGPMAKPHRMALLTIACGLTSLETAFSQPHRVMGLALILVAVGCVVTVARRLQLIASDLNERA